VRGGEGEAGFSREGARISSVQVGEGEECGTKEGRVSDFVGLLGFLLDEAVMSPKLKARGPGFGPLPSKQG
jgi:hypothetical protein